MSLRASSEIKALLTFLYRFRLHFEKESKEEVEKRKKMAREKILQAVPERDLEMDIKEVYPEEQGLSALYKFESRYCQV